MRNAEEAEEGRGNLNIPLKEEHVEEHVGGVHWVGEYQGNGHGHGGVVHELEVNNYSQQEQPTTTVHNNSSQQQCTTTVKQFAVQ